jgi:hypothetical protein
LLVRNELRTLRGSQNGKKTTAGGTAVFEFTDRDNGTFSYTPIDALPIVKLFSIHRVLNANNPN